MKKYLPKFENSGTIPKVVNGKREASGFEIKPVSSSLAPSSTEVITKSMEGLAAQSIANNASSIKQQSAARMDESIKQHGNVSGKGGGGGAMGSIAQGVGIVTDLAKSAIDVDENSSFDQEQALGDTLLKSGNPYAMIAGAAVKINSAANQAMGTNMNTISKTEAKEAGVSGAGRILNNVAGFMGNVSLPGFGAMFDKTMKATELTEETKALSDAFAGTMDSMEIAGGMSEGRYVVGRNKINKLISEANRNNLIMTEMSKINSLRKASDYGMDLAQQNLNIYSGNNYQNTHVGKHGMKLMDVVEIRKVLELRKKDEIQAFQNGGVIEGNILPTGKLHKELHHIDNSNPELAEDLTRKGIPVVAISDGEFEQVAEIERDEWTTSKEITDRIEALWKDGSEEAMIECGKLICEEILFNTRDDNNIIDGNNTNKNKQ